MAVGVFPALKLGVLFVKQISKPLAKFLVTQAKNHPLFRTYVIIPPAQFYHWAEVKTKMYVMNLGKPTKVAKLNENMAIELGASLLGEAIIFSIAGGCLIFEYNRQVTKEAKKEEVRQMQIQKFTDDIQALYNTVLRQESQITYLQDAVNELAKHTKYKLKTPEIVSPQTKSNNFDDNTEERSNKNSENIVEANAESENKSLIQRAIVYYNNELKGDKLR
ncbi:optic atrophy 3 protein homolog [Pseudomyrmex gracilis]|uniref:optic atrophy 3 protein homolog n=1 Tax=Pseudomyrmex gracilis TaxID=219809 RepID=UPI000994E21D|nr:optic atrophy 3 protein homolog [Pseudomyrmex gracilis]